MLPHADYAGNNPSSVVRIGNSAGSQQVAVSTDGGASWNVHYGAGTTQYGGAVAYSSGADTILWSPSNAGVLRSQNQGTFTVVDSLPSGAVIASDKRNNTFFYAGSGATFYRSDNTAASFVAVSGALGTATSVRDIVAHPRVAGEVWVSTDIGLFRSRDFGVTFGRVGAGILSNTQHISLGLGTASAWNVYALGKGASGAKLYASGDDGTTWVDIQGSQGFGALSACRIVGSANVAGQVYVGTNGRGVLYAKGAVGSGGTTTLVTSSTAKPTSIDMTSSPSSSVRSTSVSTSATTSTSSTVGTLTVSVSSSSSGGIATTQAPMPTALASRWQQCGGIGWAGATTCVTPWSCKYQNDWYSQCL